MFRHAHFFFLRQPATLPLLRALLMPYALYADALIPRVAILMPADDFDISSAVALSAAFHADFTPDLI